MTLPSLRRRAVRRAVSILALALLTGAAPAAQAQQKAAAAPPAPTEDFYAKRASTLLQNEDPQPAAHPLAAALPETTVVVCEAGCPSGGAEVVYAARGRGPAGAQPAPEAGEATGHAAECVAGCYASSPEARKN